MKFSVKNFFSKFDQIHSLQPVKLNNKVNDKVKNKDTIDVVLASLLLTWSHFTSCYSVSIVDFD